LDKVAKELAKAQAITIKKELRYYFTPDDKLKMGDEMAAAVEQIAEIQEDKAKYMAGIKDRLSKAEGVINSNGRKLRQGWELRMIECSMVKDFETNFVKITRNDTGEVVEERAMTVEERQRELDLGQGPPPPSPGEGTHEELTARN